MMSDDASRRSPAGFLTLAVVSAIFLSSLGVWQLHRLTWKEALIAERRLAFSVGSIELTDITQKLAEWSRVRLTGHFLHGKSLFVGPRSWRGVPHWRLVTGFELASGGNVLVDRGWSPYSRSKAEIFRPEGVVSIKGIVRYPAPPGPFTPVAPPQGDEWIAIDPLPMVGRLGIPWQQSAPFWINAMPMSGDGRYPTADARLILPPNNHLGYAITWFGLAAGVLGVAGAYWRRSRKTTS